MNHSIWSERLFKLLAYVNRNGLKTNYIDSFNMLVSVKNGLKTSYIE